MHLLVNEVWTRIIEHGIKFDGPRLRITAPGVRLLFIKPRRPRLKLEAHAREARRMRGDAHASQGSPQLRRAPTDYTVRWRGPREQLIPLVR